MFFTSCGSPLSRGSIRVPAAFMSASPQTLHKISPPQSSTVSQANVGRKPYSPCVNEEKSERGERERKKAGEREKKGVLRPGKRAKFNLLWPPLPHSLKPRHVFDVQQVYWRKKKKTKKKEEKEKKTCLDHYRWNWESIAHEGMGSSISLAYWTSSPPLPPCAHANIHIW